MYDIYIVLIKENRAGFDKSKANRESEQSAQVRKSLADLKLTASPGIFIISAPSLNSKHCIHVLKLSEIIPKDEGPHNDMLYW